MEKNIVSRLSNDERTYLINEAKHVKNGKVKVFNCDIYKMKDDISSPFYPSTVLPSIKDYEIPLKILNVVIPSFLIEDKNVLTPFFNSFRHVWNTLNNIQKNEILLFAYGICDNHEYRKFLESKFPMLTQQSMRNRLRGLTNSFFKSQPTQKPITIKNIPEESRYIITPSVPGYNPNNRESFGGKKKKTTTKKKKKTTSKKKSTKK
jgi:hypothetical protein